MACVLADGEPRSLEVEEPLDAGTKRSAGAALSTPIVDAKSFLPCDLPCAAVPEDHLGTSAQHILTIGESCGRPAKE
jgi:hypothetical protein